MNNCSRYHSKLLQCSNVAQGILWCQSLGFFGHFQGFTRIKKASTCVLAFL